MAEPARALALAAARAGCPCESLRRACRHAPRGGARRACRGSALAARERPSGRRS